MPILIHFLLFIGIDANASTQALVLSGGSTPAANHHSQYIQTKAVADYLRAHLSPKQVSVRFAAGNNTSSQPFLADVHRIIMTANGPRSAMLPGKIAGNRSATRENVIQYFSGSQAQQRNPRIDTLFLFVSGHGTPNHDDNEEIDSTYSNNCIDLWGYKADIRQQSFTTLESEERCFSRLDLQKALASKKAKRTVFAMSQCYSGGFHYLSVNTDGAYPSANTRICGFTATTSDAIAAGCTPEVNTEYQGYERYFTEQLIGRDLVTGERLHSPRRSLQEAHREATLQDLTVDIPLATSDFYLLQWFDKIMDSKFSPRTQAISAFEARKIALTKNHPSRSYLASREYRSKSRFFADALRAIERQHSEYRSTLYGDLSTLETMSQQLQSELHVINRDLELLQDELSGSLGTLYAEWSQYTSTGTSPQVQAYNDMETNIFYRYDLDFGFGKGDQAALHTLAMTTLSNTSKTEQISSYKATRQNRVLQWAYNSGNPSLISVAWRARGQLRTIDKKERVQLDLSKRQALLRRALIYRKALGAWNALEAMGDAKALKEVHALQDCEATPLL